MRWGGGPRSKRCRLEGPLQGETHKGKVLYPQTITRERVVAHLGADVPLDGSWESVPSRRGCKEAGRPDPAQGEAEPLYGDS